MQIHKGHAAAWYERQSLLTAQQKAGLDAALQAVEPASITTSQQRTLLFDTIDASTMRHLCTGRGFVQVLTLESSEPGLTAESDVTLALDTRVGELWSRRALQLSLRDVELFLRAGIQPPLPSGMDRLVLGEVAQMRQRLPVRPARVLSSDRSRCTLGQLPSLQIICDSDLRGRHMDLSLEAGGHGEPLLPEGCSLLRIRASQGLPLWLVAQLGRLHIRWMSPADIIQHQNGARKDCSFC